MSFSRLTLGGRSLFTAVIACCVLAPGTAPLAAQTPAPREALGQTIDSLINQQAFRAATWGVLVVNPLTRDTLISRNAGKLLVPASNMKIATTAVALARLGAGYRYHTWFAARGARHDSTLDGDLVVIGNGDPSVSDTLRGGNAMSVMEGLADSLALRGIRRITGALVSGGNAFPDSVHGFGWEWADLREHYGAGVDELFFNEGMAPTVLRQDGGRDSLFSGPAPDPDGNYLNALALALTHHGITVAGGVAARPLAPLPPVDTLFGFASLPMRDILTSLLKRSQDQMAELLLKTIGLESGGSGTAESGSRVVGQQLLAWGARSDGFVIHDGSGLSRHDLLTAETIVKVLDGIRRDSAFDVFYGALPIAGVDGTLANRMKGTPAQANVHAKTGVMGAASGLSGYVTAADGQQLIFSILCNNYPWPARAATSIADSIAAALAAYDSRSR